MISLPQLLRVYWLHIPVKRFYFPKQIDARVLLIGAQTINGERPQLIEKAISTSSVTTPSSTLTAFYLIIIETLRTPRARTPMALIFTFLNTAHTVKRRYCRNAIENDVTSNNYIMNDKTLPAAKTSTPGGRGRGIVVIMIVSERVQKYLPYSFV